MFKLPTHGSVTHTNGLVRTMHTPASARRKEGPVTRMNKGQLTKVSREGRISVSEGVDMKEYSRRKKPVMRERKSIS